MSLCLAPSYKEAVLYRYRAPAQCLVGRSPGGGSACSPGRIRTGSPHLEHSESIDVRKPLSFRGLPLERSFYAIVRPPFAHVKMCPPTAPTPSLSLPLGSGGLSYLVGEP
uniref:Uncharacterized protein n=1 Tax=Urocitellus parryii TaxID=9999 RepID=A0A8D2H383_UROPR